MITIKIKINSKDENNTRIELIQPSKKELEKSDKNEKTITAVVYNCINEALKNLEGKEKQ